MGEKNPFRTGPSDKYRETRQNPESSQSPGERLLATMLEQARGRRERRELSHDENIQRILEGMEGQRQRETGESSSTSQKDLSVQEYIDKLKDDPERKERFIKKLERAIEGRKRLERVVETASPDVQYVLLSECGSEVRAVLAGLKPASFAGMMSKLAGRVTGEHYSLEECRIMLADVASLERKTLRHIVEHDPAKDFRMMDPYPREWFSLNPRDPSTPQLGRGCIGYSLESTRSLFQEYPGTLGNNHSDGAIEVAFYRTAVPENRWRQEEKGELNLRKGLLCGIPYDAALWHSTKDSSEFGMIVGDDQEIGLTFRCRSREEKGVKEYIEDWEAVLKYSGINEKSSFTDSADSDNPFSDFQAMRKLIENDPDNPFSNVSASQDKSLDNAKDSKELIKSKHDNPFSDDNPFKD